MSEKDYLFRGELGELDPDVAELIRHETARQARTLIMIPSESTVPEAVREAVGSAFHNIYAEGYPLESTRRMSQQEILDYNRRLPEYRRYADNRYYKGTEYANIVEALARRRVAEAFATDDYDADRLYVNVQPLSGSPANSAVYTALIKPGDTILSMDLIMGGHLSHGSPVSRSGKFHNIISYTVDPETEQLDYDEMMALALEHKPKIVVGGYSSYPMAPDWKKYREIADACGAYLLADVAHVAGLIVAGEYPNPIGYADIVTFTTHKTLNGPRGAVIITHKKSLSTKLDRGVFPGEQGGPHMNSVAGLAVAMRLASSGQFHALQKQIAANAKTLSKQLETRGIRVCYGGTESHMFSVDCKSVVGADGTTLSGDMAARILDLVGIVANRQTIPGDTSAFRPSGVRFGTVWITQRGFGDAECVALGDIIADVMLACKPFAYTGSTRPEPRAKLPFAVLQDARLRIRDLIDSIGVDTDAAVDGYPHFSYVDDDYENGAQTFAIRGKNAQGFLDIALTSDVRALDDGDSQTTHVLDIDGSVMASGVLEMQSATEYHLTIDGNSAQVAAWLRSLSDGFVILDNADVYAKAPGSVDIAHIGAGTLKTNSDDSGYAVKGYHVGLNGENYAGDLPGAKTEFSWSAPEVDTLLKTPLHAVHQELGGKMAEFAGYDMPLWYDKVLTEHMAVREAAGIFDVTHMGVFEATGAGAEAFLNAVTTNDVTRLKVGSSHYTFLLDVDGIPHDDLLIYRRGDEHFMLVVNASNNDKNWAWLNGIKDGTIMIDEALPGRTLRGDTFELRDLRAESSGADRRVDIALQGPKSRDILMSLTDDAATKSTIKKMMWGSVRTVTLGDFDLIISRTGYTGERIAYEVFPHPDQAEALFKALIAAGATPCGLAARDSLRIEAGLPLYGHELAGDLNMNPADAGMGNYVKLHKPFFVGKAAFIQHEIKRDKQLIRFRMENKGARPAHQGDPLVDGRGRVVGIVTSCSVDSDGYQLGHAYIKREFRFRGTALSVFAGSARAKVKSISETKIGDKVTMPESVKVISRFPKRK